MPDMRESDLLKKIFASNQSLPGSITIEPGDDMGAVQIGDTQVLLTTDQLADGVHFTLSGTPIEFIGRKAITRNLSDVAAMAAKPVGAVAAACLNKNFGQDRAEQLFNAMRNTALAYDCPLFGGDISMWDKPTVLTVTIVAQPAGIEPVLRSGARVGDVVYVSGQLGGSLETIDGYCHHLQFEPRINLARMLARQFNISAMIDLSDGLAVDLEHICQASEVRAQLDAQALPLSPAALQHAEKSNCPPWQCALGDAEDYELCFTAGKENSIPSQIDGVDITSVGVIAASESDMPIICLNLPDGTNQDVTELGWEHHD